MQVYVVLVPCGGEVGSMPEAVFADPDDAQNYIDHGKHLGNPDAERAQVVPLELTYGQKLWST